MNKKIIFIICMLIIIVIVFIFTFMNKDSTNISEISKDDEKQILEYLDTKTNDISRPSKGKNGKLYSSYKLLGIEQNKIYIWLVKEEYVGDKSIGNVVACPVVLYVKKDNHKILIKKHSFSEDGINYGKSIQKFFPENIREIMSGEIDSKDTDELRNNIKMRVQENL